MLTGMQETPRLVKVSSFLSSESSDADVTLNHVHLVLMGTCYRDRQSTLDC